MRRITFVLRGLPDEAMPCLRIFFAALRSRSRTEPQSGQIHNLSLSLSSLFTYPQCSQVLLDAKYLSTLRISHPYFEATCSSFDTKAEKARSETLRPHRRFIPSIFRSSIQIVSYLRHNSWQTFHCQSSLRLSMRLCCLEMDYAITLRWFDS